jgi:hypothetical protein
VREGVFAGVEGVVTELRHQCRIVLTLSAVRQCFSLEVALDGLEMLSDPGTVHPAGGAPALSY